MIDLILVGSGSFLGGNARYILATFIANRFGSAFPYGTLIINVTGSLVIGVLLTYILERSNLNPNYRLVFVVGFLGAYTTFSTYTFDALTLMQDGQWFRSIIYLVGTVALGMICVAGGMLVGRNI